MNRGLTLKCLQCDSHEFHILYEMGSQPGGVPTRDNRETLSVSIVAMSRTQRSKRRWWQKSSRNVRPMNRERRTIQSPKSDGDVRQVFAHVSDDDCTS